MKYLAILKDSFREAIDSKVFFVMVGISVFLIAIGLTLRFDPQPSDTGLQTMAREFEDLGVRFLGLHGGSYVEYKVSDIENLNQAAKPWEAQYRFNVKVSDLQPPGFALVVLLDIFKTEEELERANHTGKKTRLMKLQEEMETQAREHPEKMNEVFGRVLKEELDKLTGYDYCEFIRKQFIKHGNWDVGDVELVKVDRDRKPDIKKPEAPEIVMPLEDHYFTVELKSKSSTFRLWPHNVSLFFGLIKPPFLQDAQPGHLVDTIEDVFIGTIGSGVAMLLSSVITAFFIPNMLRKGTIDLLIAKPINRVTLLVYKYIGGLTFMFLNTAVMIGGIWFAIALRSGIWAPAFLLMIFVLTYQFAIFYAISCLFAVLTRSPIVSILMCLVAWAILAGFGFFYIKIIDKTRDHKLPWFPESVYSVSDGAHFFLPHYKDFDTLGSHVVEVDLVDPSEPERLRMDRELGSVQWTESIAVTSAWIVALLGTACWRFAVKDY